MWHKNLLNVFLAPKYILTRYRNVNQINFFHINRMVKHSILKIQFPDYIKQKLLNRYQSFCFNSIQLIKASLFPPTAEAERGAERKKCQFFILNDVIILLEWRSLFRVQIQHHFHEFIIKTNFGVIIYRQKSRHHNSSATMYKKKPLTVLTNIHGNHHVIYCVLHIFSGKKAQ